VNGFNLSKLKEFCKSGIPSFIGTIYYVWHINTDRSKAGFGRYVNFESNDNLNSKSDFNNTADLKTGSSEKTIFFLSNSERSFDFFINFLTNNFPHCPIIEKSSPEIEKELEGYLSGKTREIGLEPVYLYGTDFEKKIWETARKIPYGNVASYKELAQKAGYPNAFRAAGTALGNNPLMLVVPCHRVIRSNGEIGYFGGGEEVKLMLLDLEQPQQEK
jgi:O-6-methylguanine DNA methyltransferase